MVEFVCAYSFPDKKCSSGNAVPAASTPGSISATCQKRHQNDGHHFSCGHKNIKIIQNKAAVY